MSSRQCGGVGVPPHCSGDNRDSRDKYNRPQRQNPFVFDKEIDRHSRTIDDKSDGSSGGDKRFFGQVKSQHCCGTNTALVTDETSEHGGNESAHPFPDPLQFQPRGKTRYSRRSGKNQQGTEHVAEYGTAGGSVQDSSGQAADRAGYTKT